MTKKERDLEKQVTELYQTLRRDCAIKQSIFYTAAGLGLSVKKVEKILGFDRENHG